jgi:chromosome segregation ATPase
MATQETRLRDLATRIATEAKALRTLINGNAADLSALQTTAKTTLVAALNELKASISALGSGSSATWSSQKISDQITAAIAAITNNAPAALDTLKELADAINDDAAFSAAVTTALGNRLRFDAAQTLTAPQKAQGNANLGSAALVDTGTLDTDFVAVFNAGLV